MGTYDLFGEAHRCAAVAACPNAWSPSLAQYPYCGSREPDSLERRPASTSGLCRPLAQNGLWRWRSLRWSRHNHSASRNARSLSFGYIAGRIASHLRRPGEAGQPHVPSLACEPVGFLGRLLGALSRGSDRRAVNALTGLGAHFQRMRRARCQLASRYRL
jgi:hypothetical protein